MRPQALPSSGEGFVAVESFGGQTRVTRTWAKSPLKLLEPRNHGGAAWLFAATYGGGLVDGDQIGLGAHVGAGAGLLIGTQASTKVFPSRVGASQRLTAEVEEGGLLALVPDPVVCFAGARYTQDISVALAGGGSLLLVDGLNAGRTAGGERWDFDHYASRIAVVRDGKALADDAVRLDPAEGELRARMGRFEALATVIALGPRCAGIAQDLLAPAEGSTGPRAALRVAASPLKDGAIARIAGTSVERVGRELRRLLQRLPELLGDDPFRARG